MPHIDYYFSPTSPNCYFAGTRPGEIAEKHGATISYKPVDVMALFARTGGTPPPERHASRQAYRLIEIERTGRVLGMPVNPKPAFWPTNPAPAAYAVIAAGKAGGGDLGGLVAGITRACWAEERNVAEDAVIRQCLEAAGFDPGLADSGLLTGAMAYEQNLEDAVAAGVFGVPFFVTDGGALFWGQDRLDQLDSHLAGDL